MDWFDSLDLEQSAKNCRTDIIGDWHRDPWGWPELDWLITDNGKRYLEQRLNGAGTKACVAIEVPKENFGIRPALVLDPVDRFVYQLLVDAASKSLIGNLGRWIFGWRLPPGNPTRAHYARNDYQWKNYRTRLRVLNDIHPAALTTDIVSCFASIPISRISERIGQQAGFGKITNRIVSLLESWDRVPGRSGLPQRSMASAVLANMYMEPLEMALRQALPRAFSQASEELPAARWMDDIWVFGGNEASLRNVQVSLYQAMFDLSLNMNFAKTDVQEGEGLKNKVKELELGYIDYCLKEEDGETGPLEELLESTLERPVMASRTKVRFLTHRIRTHGLFQFVENFLMAANEMPHCGDYVGRLFRESGQWADLQHWFLEYSRSDWAVFDWSVASFGRMFPANAAVDKILVEHFAEIVANESGSLPLIALAAQRLAAWNPATAKAAIRAAAGKTHSPHLRRVLALAGLSAGDELHYIRRLLSEVEENRPTLMLLEDRNYKPLVAQPDFSGR